MAEPLCQPAEIVTRIRDGLRSRVGTKIVVKANLGRCRIMEKEATIEQTHPNLFVVKVDESEEQARRISYSYADVITKTVELFHADSREQIVF